MKFLILVLSLLTATQAWASSTRTIVVDSFSSSDLSKSWTPPSITDTLVGRASTDTLLNKTLSGASNTFSNIPVGAIGNGSALSGSNTGDVTIGTANGLSLSSQVLSLQAADATHIGALTATDWNTFNGKQASGSYITALTGDVSASGPGSASATLASSGVTAGSYTNANITVDAKGRVTVASSGSSSSTVKNGSVATPQSITAAGGIAPSTLAQWNTAYVSGSGGAVTVTANPSISGCGSGQDGDFITIVGEDATNTVTLNDGNGLSLNGPIVLGLNSVLLLQCDGSTYQEVSRR